MTQLPLDAEGMYNPRAINREVLFDTERTEGECIVVVPNVSTKLCGL